MYNTTQHFQEIDGVTFRKHNLCYSTLLTPGSPQVKVGGEVLEEALESKANS